MVRLGPGDDTLQEQAGAGGIARSGSGMMADGTSRKQGGKDQ
jgi:hypothetical protein